MNREEALAELRSIASDQNEVTPLTKVIRKAYQTAAMMRDEGMSRRVEAAVEALLTDTSRETEALGWLSSELATRAGASEGTAPDWFPEPPEWLELWEQAQREVANA